jgi:hypothetical protein
MIVTKHYHINRVLFYFILVWYLFLYIAPIQKKKVYLYILEYIYTIHTRDEAILTRPN